MFCNILRRGGENMAIEQLQGSEYPFVFFDEEGAHIEFQYLGVPEVGQQYRFGPPQIVAVCADGKVRDVPLSEVEWPFLNVSNEPVVCTTAFRVALDKPL